MPGIKLYSSYLLISLTLFLRYLECILYHLIRILSLPMTSLSLQTLRMIYKPWSKEYMMSARNTGWRSAYQKPKLWYSVLFHIRNLWRIRKFIDTATCHHAARALVLPRIDYCNALFTCLSAKNTSRLQRLQNSGARVVFAVGRRTEAESLLRTLHWLPVPQRVTFKILLYTYIKRLMNRHHCT